MDPEGSDRQHVGPGPESPVAPETRSGGDAQIQKSQSESVGLPHSNSRGWSPRTLYQFFKAKIESPRALNWLTALLAFSALATATTTVIISPKIMTLTESQVYQGGYSTRIGVTTIWHDGYPADTRNRVSKFSVSYADWIKANGGEAIKEAMESVDILANQGRVFNGKSIRENQNLMRLLDSDLEEKRRALWGEAGWRRLKEEEKLQALSDNDLVDAALKYRNAIIECLNAMEAIQAIMANRPERLDQMMPDDLERRYRDLISDLTGNLSPFICKYREANQRKTPPWDILLSDAECSVIWNRPYPYRR